MLQGFSDAPRALADLAARARSYAALTERPFVTLCYAQALDGTIACADGAPLRISCPEASRFTHALRARHDAILVGVGTVLSDNPRLTTRLCPGPSPRPIVLDSRLRTPHDARVLASPAGPILACTLPAAASPTRGATLLHLPATPDGRVALEPLLQEAKKQGIGSVMVEGGSRVIASFLRERLVQAVVVTVSLRYEGGRPVLGGLAGGMLPRIQPTHVFWVGGDLVVQGAPIWEDPP